jgi:hypothetical protein
MIWLYLNLRKLKKESSPSSEFKAELLAEILKSVDEVVIYRSTRIFKYALAPISLALLLGVGTTSYAYASPSVCHGHILYPLKTGVETMEKTFYRTPDAQAQFQMKSLERRADEVGYAIDHGAPQLIILQRIPDEFDLTEGRIKAAREMRKEQERAVEEIQNQMEERAEAVLKDFRKKVEKVEMDEVEKKMLLEKIDDRLEKIEAM